MKVWKILKVLSQLSGKKNAKIFEFDFQCCIPDPENLRNFVIKPQLPDTVRLHCTMIRHSEKSSNLIENSQTSTNAGANSTMSNASGSSAAAAANGISDVNSNNPLSDSGNTADTSNSAASTSGSANQSNNTTSAYTLYLEHLGGFLPILKGKRVSKIRPEFIIYDPQLPGTYCLVCLVL